MITDISINNVEAKRQTKDTITNMKFNINFDNVKVMGDTVEVAYTFVTNYESGSPSAPKSVGDLKIVGSISSKEDKRQLENIEKTWKEKKTLPLDFAENVINLLNFECGARGTLVAYSIGFVAPLPLSRARLQEKE